MKVWHRISNRVMLSVNEDVSFICAVSIMYSRRSNLISELKDRVYSSLHFVSQLNTLHGDLLTCVCGVPAEDVVLFNLCCSLGNRTNPGQPEYSSNRDHELWSSKGPLIW